MRISVFHDQNTITHDHVECDLLKCRPAGSRALVDFVDVERRASNPNGGCNSARTAGGHNDASNGTDGEIDGPVCDHCFCSRCSARAMHWVAILASSSSMVAMCLLTRQRVPTRFQQAAAQDCRAEINEANTRRFRRFASSS